MPLFLCVSAGLYYKNADINNRRLFFLNRIVFYTIYNIICIYNV